MNREHVSTAELVGRLGQKPELKLLENGTPYVQLSVATSERYTDRTGAIKEKTEWHRGVAWGEVAETIAKSFDKGDSVVLSGAMRINSYEHDGTKDRTTDIHVASLSKNTTNEPSKNEVRLVGVVREDAKAKTLENGTAMTMVSVETKTLVNGKERNDWHSITMWQKTAEAARDIKAGDVVAINGSLRHRSVTTDGQERKLSAIDGRQFQVLERAQDRAQDRAKAPEAPPREAPERARPRSRGRGKDLDRGL
jgi:single-strand DNA-binding protein